MIRIFAEGTEAEPEVSGVAIVGVGGGGRAGILGPALGEEAGAVRGDSIVEEEETEAGPITGGRDHERGGDEVAGVIAFDDGGGHAKGSEEFLLWEGVVSGVIGEGEADEAGDDIGGAAGIGPVIAWGKEKGFMGSEGGCIAFAEEHGGHVG